MQAWTVHDFGPYQDQLNLEEQEIPLTNLCISVSRFILQIAYIPH
jgi:hypothetical protein